MHVIVFEHVTVLNRIREGSPSLVNSVAMTVIPCFTVAQSTL